MSSYTSTHATNISTAKLLNIGTDVEAEIITGYPHNRYNAKHLRTMGIILRNQGQARTIKIEIGGDMPYKRSVSLPNEGQRRIFIYLPNDNISYYASIKITDLLTGLSKHSRHLPLSGQYESSVYNPRYMLGQLGQFDFPVNVVEPWQTLGSQLDGDKMPDSWRGLTGLTALMIDYRQFQHSYGWQSTVIDWVLMGGILLLVQPTELPVANLSELAPQLPLQYTQPMTDKPMWQVGLGYIALVPSTHFAKLDADFLPELGLDFLPFRALYEHEYHQSLPIERPSDTAYRLLAADTGHIPHWSLFFLLLIFALLIGPWGWFIFIRRRGKPFMYLLVVFSGASLFSIGLLVVTFLAEGVEPRVLHNSTRVVDLRTDTQLLFTQSAVFAPLEYHIEVRTPLNSHLFLDDVASASNRRVHSTYTDVDWQYWQNLLPVRQRRILATRQVQTLSGKLLIQQLENGDLRIENHLYGDLTQLQVWHDGRYFQFDALARGARQTVAPSAFTPAISINQAGLPLEYANALATDIRQGQLGERHFVGTFAEIEPRYALFYQGYYQLQTGQHVLAGVY